jgi:hypothetical protein
VLDILVKHNVPFLVGGAFALNCYAGIARDTKDLDLFVRKRDCEAVLELLARLRYHTELTFPHSLGKAYSGDRIIDFIFNSGNGQCGVDDDWFRYAVEATALGRPPEILSDHPSDAHRIAQLRRWIPAAMSGYAAYKAGRIAPPKK